MESDWESVNPFEEKLAFPNDILRQIALNLTTESALSFALAHTSFLDAARYRLYRKVVFVDRDAKQRFLYSNERFTVVPNDTLFRFLDLVRLSNNYVGDLVQEIWCFGNISWRHVTDSWYTTIQFLPNLETLIWPELPLMKYVILPLDIRENIKSLSISVDILSHSRLNGIDQTILYFPILQDLSISLSCSNLRNSEVCAKLLLRGGCLTNLRRLRISYEETQPFSQNLYTPSLQELFESADKTKRSKKKMFSSQKQERAQLNEGWLLPLVTFASSGSMKLASLSLDKVCIRASDVDSLSKCVNLGSLRHLEVTNTIQVYEHNVSNSNTFLLELANRLACLESLALEIRYLCADCVSDCRCMEQKDVLRFLQSTPPLTNLRLFTYDVPKLEVEHLWPHRATLRKLNWRDSASMKRVFSLLAHHTFYHDMFWNTQDGVASLERYTRDLEMVELSSYLLGDCINPSTRPLRGELNELLQGYMKALFHNMIRNLDEHFTLESLRLFGITLSV